MRTYGRCMLGLCALLMACSGGSSNAEPQVTAPEAFDDHECAACGMIVRDQPSPRGQVVHRDGTRVYLCAIADMLTYLDAPSRHGAAVAVYVEASAPGVDDPRAHDMRPRPWIPATDAHFVTGFDRERVMGAPFLTYAKQEDAQRVATDLDAQVLDWNRVRAPSPQPEHAHRPVGKETR
jgi:copper chaperone NosL